MSINREDKFIIPLDEVAINGKFADGWTLEDEEERSVDIEFEDEPDEEMEEEETGRTFKFH